MAHHGMHSAALSQYHRIGMSWCQALRCCTVCSSPTQEPLPQAPLLHRFSKRRYRLQAQVLKIREFQQLLELGLTKALQA